MSAEARFLQPEQCLRRNESLNVVNIYYLDDLAEMQNVPVLEGNAKVRRSSHRPLAWFNTVGRLPPNNTDTFND